MKSTNELRIGNLVQDEHGFQMEVVALFKDDTVYLDFEGNEGDVWEEDVKDLKGIPLTEEWLIEFGFIKSGYIPVWMSKRLIHDEIDKIDILVNEKKQMYFVPSVFVKWSVELKYVHHLQNIYFSLTGQELTIK